MTFKITVTSQNFKKKYFSTKVDETLHFGVNRCISGHVILQNMKFIRLAISQPFLKIETSGLDQKIL